MQRAAQEEQETWRARAGMAASESSFTPEPHLRAQSESFFYLDCDVALQAWDEALQEVKARQAECNMLGAHLSQALEPRLLSLMWKFALQAWEEALQEFKARHVERSVKRPHPTRDTRLSCNPRRVSA